MTALLSAGLTAKPYLVTKTKQFERRVARPMFHLAPTLPRGWINDPNGPLLHNGNYHLFWQNVPGSAEWTWGLGWGHATSKDLVQWKQLPVALEPTPDSPDQHGCFSGCATVDANGVPSILYTGVVRQPHPTPTHESQLIAVAADPDDPELKDWVKLPGTFLPNPPAAMDLTGWRDPFVLEKPSSCSASSGEGDHGHSPWWYVMVGAGVNGKCGTALVYRSRNLTEGWEYVGPLCESSSSHMWECPIMGTLTNVQPHIDISSSHSYSYDHTAVSSENGHSSGLVNGNNSSHGSVIQRHMLCVSPDYCVNIPVYWLGDYKSGRFDLEGADGPHPLDLGDILYAPNILTDKHGRTVLWAWMQEKPGLRPAGTYDASCCLCVPRVLYLSTDGNTLLQEPLPELVQLRKQHTAWHIGSTAATGSCGAAAPVKLLPGVPMRLGADCCSSHVDLEVTVAKGNADSVVLVLQPFDGLPGAAGAGVAYCWNTHTLQVIHSTDLATLQSVAATPIEPPVYKKLPAPSVEQEAAGRAPEAGAVMRCGGELRNNSSNVNGSADASAEVTLRIMIDGSCIEVFTSSGQALGTRVYRGDDAPLDCTPAAAAAGAAAAEAVLGASYSGRNGAIELVSFGPGAAELVGASLWEMESMWMQDATAPQQKEAIEAVEGAPMAAAAAAAQILQGLVVAEAAAAAAAAAVPLVLPVGDLTLEPTSPAVVPEPVSVEVA